MLAPATPPRPEGASVHGGFAEGLGETAAWISDTMSELGLADRGSAVTALRVGLHAVRDSVTGEEAADLGAHLPLLLREMFFEGWDPAAHRPVPFAEFLRLLRRRCGGGPAADAMARALVRVLGVRLFFGPLADEAAEAPAGGSLDAILGRTAA